MEEFEHMIVEEFNEEDFYETIEAPKFVDLTAPDHRPEGDDRYWFCSRVGCDQKHEEFMDSEVIYKNFVLRVMAARSPNVRLRKALYRKDSSVDHPKCPNTVPAKPSRSRVSRLAMISSIPQKANIKLKEAKVVSSTNKNVTPKAKVKGKESSLVSSVPKKALTERKKQQLRSPAAFRSVQNPRNAAVRVSRNRVVAKALVFHSPKKVVKLKRSVELGSSVKKLCNGMRKLEIENKRNGFGVIDHKVVSSVPSRKPLKGREVKSRVFDSLRSQKQKVKEKEEHVVLSDSSKAHGANGMELENQSLCCTNSLPRSEKTRGDEDKSEEMSDTLKTKENGVDKGKQYQTSNIEDKESVLLALECEDKENATNAADVDRKEPAVIKESGVSKAKQWEIEDKENALPLECDDKENATNAADLDRESNDKENSLALDHNRKVEHGTNLSMKKKVFGKKEAWKTTQKVMIIADTCFNGKTVSASTRVKYAKPKLTNPKPFRLRTDERRILKEANTEKKPQCALAKEETARILGFRGENLGPKHQPARLEKDTRGNVSRGTSAKLVRNDDAFENMVNCKRAELGTKKKVASKRIETVEEMSPMNGESKEVALGTKKKVASKKIGTVEEMSPMMNGESKEVASINKPCVCVVASGEKRLAATVPKGPNFHSIHVPKSCTKRLASQV